MTASRKLKPLYANGDLAFQDMILRSIVAVVLLSIPLGCRNQCQNTYIEGTSLTLGLYIPYNGNIYGIQALNYLSGKKIQLHTNQQFKVSSEHSISNKTMMLDNFDYSKVSIE